MSSRKSFTDPIATFTGLLAGIVAFVLVPGVGWALLVGLAVALLGYGVVLGVRALGAERRTTPRPAVGAGGDTTAAPRVRRGSAVETWLERGERAVGGMRRLAATSDQPVIKGQLENVVLEAGDSLPVLHQLASQSAVVQASVHRMSPGRLRDQRERLQDSVGDHTTSPQTAADQRRALGDVAEQERTLARLMSVQAGLTARMESIVLGLERLSAEMSETVASAAAATPTAPSGGTDHLRDLTEQLVGLQAGLAESRRYTAHILGPQAE